MKRNIWIDIEKLVAALLIMAFHIPHISVGFEHVHFQSAHRFVEFFLIVTGYWTAKYFVGNRREGGVLEYSFKKMIPLIPALLITTILEYLIEIKQHMILSGGLINKFQIIFEFIMENTFCSGIVGTTIHLSTTWYLQALMISLPVFILICQRLKHYEVYCMIYAVLYYQCLNDVPFFFKDNARMLAGLVVGGLCYYMSEHAKTKIIEHKKSRVRVFLDNKFFLFCGLLSFFIPVVFSFYNFEKLNLFVLCFSISVIMLSMTDGMEVDRWKMVLCELPTNLYIFHWGVGTVLYFYWRGTYYNTVVLYYVVTIILTLLFILLKEKIKEKIVKFSIR